MSSSGGGPRDGSNSPPPTKRSRTETPRGGRGFAIPGHCFPKDERILKRAEIATVFDAGARFSCKGMRLHVMPNALAVNRAVFVPVRSYRDSVTRNRARRLARECWRLGKDRLIPGHDVAIVLYPGYDEYAVRRAQLELLLGQAGMYA